MVSYAKEDSATGIPIKNFNTNPTTYHKKQLLRLTNDFDDLTTIATNDSSNTANNSTSDTVTNSSSSVDTSLNFQNNETNSMSNILLLGMVFSEEFEPKRGQEFRDRVRCLALENMGNSVKTLDDKHDDTDIQSGKHCRANFANAKRMLKSIRNKWGYDIEFDDIILD